MSRVFMWSLILLGWNLNAQAVLQDPVFFLVNKKDHRLYIVREQENGLQILKTYSVTLGKELGPKTEKNDLKTPEGVYFFQYFMEPPGIPAKLGALGIILNFPNPFDQKKGYTGFGIALHGTHQPERLLKKHDSEGCIVVSNQDVLEMRQWVRLKTTPVIIVPELSSDWMKESVKKKKLQEFFSSWVQSWESKKIDQYIQHYHSSFSSQGKTLEQWREYKKGLNTRYQSIQVGPQKMRYLYYYPGYSVIVFQQNYLSFLTPSVVGYRSQGTKILYITEDEGKLKIFSEIFSESS